jgi:hypothetical protein
MDQFLYEKLKDTPSFKEFAARDVKKITEEDYRGLMGRCLDETGIGYPTNWDEMGVMSKWAWSSRRRNTFLELFITTGVQVKWGTEFEDRLKDYLKEQGPPPEAPFAKLEWYGQKRKELEEIIAREDKEPGM